MYCIILYYTILYYITLHYILLYHIIYICNSILKWPFSNWKLGPRMSWNNHCHMLWHAVVIWHWHWDGIIWECGIRIIYDFMMVVIRWGGSCQHQMAPACFSSLFPSAPSRRFESWLQQKLYLETQHSMYHMIHPKSQVVSNCLRDLRARHHHPIRISPQQIPMGHGLSPTWWQWFVNMLFRFR